MNSAKCISRPYILPNTFVVAQVAFVGWCHIHALAVCWIAHIAITNVCLLLAQSGRSPIFKVAELHVRHPARKVGGHTTLGFTIPAAFLAFTRVTYTSASNANASPMRRFDEALGFTKQPDVRVGHARCLSHAGKHDAFGHDPFITQ